MIRRRDEKGVALIFSLVVIMTLATMGTSIFSRSISENNMAAKYAGSSQAFWLAEAGTQRGIHELNYGGGAWSGWSDDADGNKVILESLGTVGEYYVEIQNWNTNNPTIETLGYAPDDTDPARSERSLEVEVARQTSSPFGYGGFATGIGDGPAFTMSGNGQTDSYNSEDPYWSDNSNGDIATNSILANAVVLSGNATVNGNVATGENGGVSISGNAEVTGDITDDSNETMDPVVVPSSLTSLGSGGNYTVNANKTKTLTVGSYKFSKISVSGNGTLILDGDIEIYITSTFSISGNGVIIIADSVKLYVDGVSTISGNGVMNYTQLPKNFMLYSTYTGTSDGVKVTGNGSTYGVVYAPQTEVKISGNGDIYGSLVGGTVKITGNGDLHYDEALKNLGGGCTNYAVEQWKEQQNPYYIEVDSP